MKNKLVAVGVLTCALSGFGLGLLEMPKEAEAALLPNPASAVVEVQEVEIAEPVKLYTQADVEMLARLIYTEARGVGSKTEQAAVVCDRRESSELRRGESECVLNRLDNPDRPENSITEVVTAPYQFDYRPWAPVLQEFAELAQDVLERWQAEKQGAVDVGRATGGSPASHAGASRILPAEYQYFEGRDGRNWFSAEWKSAEYWGWELPSPYED